MGRGVSLLHIQPGKPTQNACIERWLTIYNERRPHDGVGRVPPLAFLPRSPAPPESSFQRSA